MIQESEFEVVIREWLEFRRQIERESTTLRLTMSEDGESLASSLTRSTELRLLAAARPNAIIAPYTNDDSNDDDDDNDHDDDDDDHAAATSHRRSLRQSMARELEKHKWKRQREQGKLRSLNRPSGTPLFRTRRARAHTHTHTIALTCWSMGAEVYSLHDLVEAQSGRLAAFLGEVSSGWLQHIARCELCRGKGSFCEVCNSDRPIYPFQVPLPAHTTRTTHTTHDTHDIPHCGCCMSAAAYDDQVRSLPRAVPPGVLRPAALPQVRAPHRAQARPPQQPLPQLLARFLLARGRPPTTFLFLFLNHLHLLRFLLVLFPDFGVAIRLVVHVVVLHFVFVSSGATQTHVAHVTFF